MAKVTAPLLSFGASGQIAKTQVYAKWKGRPYVRRHTTPSNPQSAEQSLTRNAFTFLNSVYKVAPALMTDPWEAYVQGIPMTARNAFQKFNLPVLRPETSLDLFVGSPGAKGGLPPTAAVATPGSGQLSIAITAPSVVPTGWTVYSAIAIAIREQDPQSGILYTVTAGEDLTSAYAVVLTGLSANEYQYRAWLKWNRPDGSFAFSPAIGGQSTPS